MPLILIKLNKNLRISRRRTTYAEPPVKAIATRVSTRASFNTSTTNSVNSTLSIDQFSNVFAEDSLIVEEEEDEEWNATSTLTKKRTKTRALKKLT